jgi:predicted adenine nucleotide alpha hydrolase (AANH) superfamily ATPase
MPRDHSRLASFEADAVVLDATGQRLAPCSRDKARKLLAHGKARLISQEPLVIQLPLTADLHRRHVTAADSPGQGRRLLLHICCGPCSTYTIRRLRQQGFEVTGFWYNPNVHPLAEHERRRECMRMYAESVELPMLWSEVYELSTYLLAVAGREARGERCPVCYRLRLERTATVARQQGFNAFTTTLLISPHQHQGLIRSIGEELAIEHGLEFYFENLRKGWADRGQLAREHGLYRQTYCGCEYSEHEAQARQAATGTPGETAGDATGGAQERACHPKAPAGQAGEESISTQRADAAWNSA